MKLTLVKTCFWVFAHLVAHRDTFSIADELYVHKQYKAVVEICNTQIKKLSKKDSLFEKFLSLRSESYLQLHEYDLGIKDYLLLIQIEPKQIKYYVGLSYLYGEAKQYTNCINILKRALKLDDKYVYAWNNLSYYSSQAGNYDDAINYADEGLKYTTDPSWEGALLNNKGYGYIGLKRYSEALVNINKAIKLDPNNSFAYCFRAIANINLKRMETVCDDLSKAKSLGAISLTVDLIKENCKN